jgi:uncharacterized protein
MPNNIFAFSVPAFLRGHAILADLLQKAAVHAEQRKIAPSVLLTARLYPDMFPLIGQVQAACDTSKRATARLVGAKPPRFEDNETTFGDPVRVDSENVSLSGSAVGRPVPRR